MQGPSIDKAKLHFIDNLAEETEEELVCAMRAAERAGEIIRNGYEETQTIEEKGFGDLCSKVDKESDRVIQEEIRAQFPQDAILSEEISPEIAGKKGRFWVIDPLDGTSAFLFKTAEDMPSVMIALQDRGETKMSVVYFPLTKEMFYAVKGKGAYKDETPLQCRDSKLEVSWVDMNQHSDVQYESLIFQTLRVNLRKPGGARLVTTFPPNPGGSVRIAHGKKKFSAVIHDNGSKKVKLGPWDIIPPALILKEAGGVVVNFRNESCDPFKPEPFIMATSQSIASAIINLANSLGSEDSK